MLSCAGVAYTEVFIPTREEIARWQGLVKAMEERRQQGGAAVTYGGDMVDVAHEETARAMLAMVREWGILEA
jgi:citrate lyase beta subunit